MINRSFRVLLSLSCLIVVTSCDDGAGFAGPIGGPPAAGPPPPPPPAPPPQGSYVLLTSETGDFVGAGESYVYSKADSVLTVTVEDARLTVDIDGDEWWTGEFQLPDALLQLEAGTYPNLTRYPFHDAIVGGLSWTGEGRGCNTLDGSITIDSVVYDAGAAMTDINLSFEQYCEGNSPALRGEVHWDASDTTTPPGPAADPGNLWEPMRGTTPATDNYIYLTSQQGDFIGGGADYLYTDATAAITVDATDGRVSVSVTGAEGWGGEFQGMNFLTELEAGYYADLQRYPFHNPVKGGLSWSGEGRGCNTLTGWFVVDSVTYNGAAVTAIDLRFEQHCEGNPPGLFGEIHWVQ